MIAKELYSLSAAPIVNAIFSSKWSEDDQISVITDVGAHTFELIPTPLSAKRILQLNRSYLYPSDFLPTEKYAEEVNNYILTWEREQVYTLLLEAAISPKPNRANPTVPRIIDVAWSPKGLVQPEKCMLATLTSVGAVDITIKINRQWFSIHDLSYQWSKHLEEQTTNDQEENYAMYVAKARRLQATSITWSKLEKKDSKQFAYLAIAYRSSDLVIWKIQKVSDKSEQDIPPATIIHKSDLSCDIRVKIMEWINISDGNYYLFIGYYDGRVQCLKMKEDSETILDVQSSDEYLLESDRIPVSSIFLLQKCNDGIEIIITKGSFLLYLVLNENDILVKNLKFRCPGFQITGATVVSSKEVLIFSEDGKLTLVTILSDNIQGKSVKNEIVTNRLRCLGLSSSRNNCLFVTVTSPNSIYDHLVQREPTTIHFFFLDDERKDPFNILLNENVGMHLGNYWDCLEVLRMKIIDDQKYCDTLYTRNDLECMSFGFLRITMWINVIKQNCYKSEASSNQNSYNSNEAKSLIFLHSAVGIIVRLVKKSELSEEEKTFMRLLKVYLEVYIGINDNTTLISKTIRQALTNVANLLATKDEVCGLCKKPICDSSSTTSLCSSGHKLPRCALTLMQITSVKFRICPVCKMIFHIVVENIWKVPKCLYCNVALVFDTRVSGMKCKGNMKNLSKASSALLKGMGGDNNGMDEEEGEGDM